MSNISSNCLFHFTPTVENLIGILRNEFYPKYSLEKVMLNNDSSRGFIDCAIPMVCFCDISLGQIKNHVTTYGSYGIGMTKEWGTKKKLNPVIYINGNSQLATCFSTIAETVTSAKGLNKLSIKLAEQILTVSDYIKPYEDDFFRNGKLLKKVRFYNEREWRYVPKLPNGEGWESVISNENYNDPIYMEKENNKLKKIKLSFVPNDIKYIFVKEQKEILAMVRALREIKGAKYSLNSIEILTSRILTADQIINDF